MSRRQKLNADGRLASRRVQTELSPKTVPQREYIENWNVAADVFYAATQVRRRAAEWKREGRGDDEVECNVHAMRQLARRLELLARSLRRVSGSLAGGTET